MFPLNLLPLYSAISIFPLWIIEQFLPYPYLIEELVKAFLIGTTVPPKNHNPYSYVALAGLSFGLSETVLYQIINIQSNSFYLFTQRFLITNLMHLLTFLIIYRGKQSGKAVFIVTIVFAIAIHYCFNKYFSFRV